MVEPDVSKALSPSVRSPSHSFVSAIWSIILGAKKRDRLLFDGHGTSNEPGYPLDANATGQVDEL